MKSTQISSGEPSLLHAPALERLRANVASVMLGKPEVIQLALATLLADGRVLLVGGNPANLSQFYNPVTDSFTFGPHLIYSRSAHSATLLPNGSLLVVGGGSQYAELYK